ncbi:MAG: hypothetical protein QNJ41_17330 [Xenococcaceae cyanobacterium MO_188.B32]|nr:hypothetical protein [Xenococcaceae cyanobacterium MO_188.B32]
MKHQTRLTLRAIVGLLTLGGLTFFPASSGLLGDEAKEFADNAADNALEFVKVKFWGDTAYDSVSPKADSSEFITPVSPSAKVNDSSRIITDRNPLFKKREFSSFSRTSFSAQSGVQTAPLGADFQLISLLSNPEEIKSKSQSSSAPINTDVIRDILADLEKLNSNSDSSTEATASGISSENLKTPSLSDLDDLQISEDFIPKNTIPVIHTSEEITVAESSTELEALQEIPESSFGLLTFSTILFGLVLIRRANASTRRCCIKTMSSLL